MNEWAPHDPCKRCQRKGLLCAFVDPLLSTSASDRVVSVLPQPVSATDYLGYSPEAYPSSAMLERPPGELQWDDSALRRAWREYCERQECVYTLSKRLASDWSVCIVG